MPQLAAARYGKDNIRVYKVHRDEATKTQSVVEMTVCVMLEGEIETSWVARSYLQKTFAERPQLYSGRQQCRRRHGHHEEYYIYYGQTKPRSSP